MGATAHATMDPHPAGSLSIPVSADPSPEALF